MTGPRDLSAEVLLTIGQDRLACRLERARAPRACASLEALLPLEGRIGHGRWSGEGGWVPLGDLSFDPPWENLTGLPRPGEILLYRGELSEPELFVPYGVSRFACARGPLQGAHVLTVDDDLTKLRKIGQGLLRTGEQPFRLALNGETDR